MDLEIYRKMLAATVSTILLEQGFDTVDKECLGTLTEMLQAFLTEIGNLSKNYCELSGRCEPLIADVILGFVEMGFNFNDIPNFVRGAKRNALPGLQPQQNPKSLNMLSAGTRQPLPSHIPHHFPQFPHPHAYVRTPTHKQPIIDYESVREKAATQKKDIEKALTKFLAKTSPIHNLFDNDDANMFPLIARKPEYPPYLSALLPQDQIYDPEDLDFDPKSQILQQAKEAKEAKIKAKKSKNEPIKEEDEDEEMEAQALNESVKSEESQNASMVIDNPYLAATKLPESIEGWISLAFICSLFLLESFV